MAKEQTDRLMEVARYAFIFVLIFGIFGYISSVLQTIKGSLDTPLIILSAVIFSTVVFILLKAKFPFTWGWIK